LTFTPFRNGPPCADGSPSGIYVEDQQQHGDEQNQQRKQPRQHVIVFIGGGACTSPDDCREGYEMEPFKFTTRLNPISIRGDTILSQNASLNARASYTKWLVPYCSQDFFLGGGSVGGSTRNDLNFTHAGSAIFHAAMQFWKEAVVHDVLMDDTRNTTFSSSSSSSTNDPLDHVVVVGMSVGAIAVLNHVDSVRQAVVAVGGWRRLQFILDSPAVLSDRPYLDKDFRAFASTYVSSLEHPLCDPYHPLSRLYTRTSALPCCLSVHCMLRHDTRLSGFFKGSSNNATGNGDDDGILEEQLLILDSAYDVFQLTAGTGFEGSADEGADADDSADSDIHGTLSRSDINDSWSLVETTGANKKRAVDTASIAKAQNWSTSARTGQPQVRWIFTSCVTHTFLVPASEILELSYLYGDYQDEDFEIVCHRPEPNGVADGFGIQFRLDSLRMNIEIQRTTETWNQATVEGRSIRNIINNYIEAGISDANFGIMPEFVGEVIDVRLTRCSGPSCLEEEIDFSFEPSCQSLIAYESVFESVPAFLYGPGASSWFCLW
jgi:hypothetical protein